MIQDYLSKGLFVLIGTGSIGGIYQFVISGTGDTVESAISKQFPDRVIVSLQETKEGLEGGFWDKAVEIYKNKYKKKLADFSSSEEVTRMNELIKDGLIKWCGSKSKTIFDGNFFGLKRYLAFCTISKDGSSFDATLDLPEVSVVESEEN